MAKLIDYLRAHPKVKEVWSEDNGVFGDGLDWWVLLHPGWILSGDDTHTIHERTLSECRDRLKEVIPCKCKWGGCDKINAGNQDASLGEGA